MNYNTNSRLWKLAYADGNTNVLLLLTSHRYMSTVTYAKHLMNKPDVFYKQVGQNIRVRRKELGLSQEGLAKAVGLKRPSMSNIEKGRQNILLHTFCDIAESLNSNANALLPQAPPPTPAQMPDLTSLSDQARKFVEAGIRPAQKEDQSGHPKTKNRGAR